MSDENKPPALEGEVWRGSMLLHALGGGAMGWVAVEMRRDCPIAWSFVDGRWQQPTAIDHPGIILTWSQHLFKEAAREASIAAAERAYRVALQAWCQHRTSTMGPTVRTRDLLDEVARTKQALVEAGGTP